MWLTCSVVECHFHHHRRHHLHYHHLTIITTSVVPSATAASVSSSPLSLPPPCRHHHARLPRCLAAAVQTVISPSQTQPPKPSVTVWKVTSLQADQS